MMFDFLLIRLFATVQYKRLLLLLNKTENGSQNNRKNRELKNCEAAATGTINTTSSTPGQ